MPARNQVLTRLASEDAKVWKHLRPHRGQTVVACACPAPLDGQRARSRASGFRCQGLGPTCRQSTKEGKPRSPGVEGRETGVVNRRGRSALRRLWITRRDARSTRPDWPTWDGGTGFLPQRDERVRMEADGCLYFMGAAPTTSQGSAVGRDRGSARSKSALVNLPGRHSGGPPGPVSPPPRAAPGFWSANIARLPDTRVRTLRPARAALSEGTARRPWVPAGWVSLRRKLPKPATFRGPKGRSAKTGAVCRGAVDGTGQWIRTGPDPGSTTGLAGRGFVGASCLAAPIDGGARGDLLRPPLAAGSLWAAQLVAARSAQSIRRLDSGWPDLYDHPRLGLRLAGYLASRFRAAGGNPHGENRFFFSAGSPSGAGAFSRSRWPHPGPGLQGGVGLARTSTTSRRVNLAARWGRLPVKLVVERRARTGSVSTAGGRAAKGPRVRARRGDGWLLGGLGSPAPIAAGGPAANTAGFFFSGSPETKIGVEARRPAEKPGKAARPMAGLLRKGALGNKSLKGEPCTRLPPVTRQDGHARAPVGRSSPRSDHRALDRRRPVHVQPGNRGRQPDATVRRARTELAAGAVKSAKGTLTRSHRGSRRNRQAKGEVPVQVLGKGSPAAKYARPPASVARKGAARRAPLWVAMVRVGVGVVGKPAVGVGRWRRPSRCWDGVGATLQRSCPTPLVPAALWTACATLTAGGVVLTPC